LACHLQTDADPDPDYHFNADLDPRILPFNLMRIHNTGYSSDCVRLTGRGATCEEKHKEEARAGGLHCQGGPGEYQIMF
jgi:hypothetical protein